MKSLTLTQKSPIWTQNFWILMIFHFCYKFEENFTEIDKIGDNPKFDEITKFEILNPKIQNFQFRQNLTKNRQILSKSPNFFQILSKSSNFNRFEIAISLVFKNLAHNDVLSQHKKKCHNIACFCPPPTHQSNHKQHNIKYLNLSTKFPEI